MSRRFAIVFICQQGRLAPQAALLAASLRRFVRFPCELIAAVPEPTQIWGLPSEQTLNYLAKLGVRIVSTINELDHTYPIGNKIGCLSVKTNADKLIFIDTDMIAMRQWEDEARFAIPFNARPASVCSFSNDAKDWDVVYAACGTKPLPGLVRTTFSGQLTPPYFNSAFIAVPAGSGFGKVWLDCCRKIDAMPGIPSKRPHLDQIALSPAISKLGLKYDCLDETYNHPINFKPLLPGQTPILCHYHEAAILAREPTAVAVARELAGADTDLAAILSADPQWSDIVGPAGAKLASGGLNFIVTGIPRSGTSYLCNLLHRHSDCIVVNEPPEVLPALAETVLPWRVAEFYGEIRRDILLGRPIQNYLDQGEVTEDTAVSSERMNYLPAVSRGDFVLGMKWPIPFLTRLPQLRRVMPAARIIACVRNPYDTIASWKTTFPRLKTADVHGKPIGNPRDPWLSGVQRSELEQIADLSDVAVRRAAWWRYLAERVIDEQEHLTLARYEEFVRDPLPLLGAMLAGSGAGPATLAIEPSQPRSKLDVLDAADVQAIRALCSDAALKLGVYRAEP
jgi:hypothetical protein